MEIIKYEAQSDTQATLTKELADANKAYRNSGITLMSDFEYDKKLEELAALEEKNGFKYDISPTDKVGAEVISELKKVTHEAPALSLDKVKYKDREDLIKWLKNSKGHDSAVISWKNDGLTVVVTYDGGKLIQAVTRVMVLLEAILPTTQDSLRDFLWRLLSRTILLSEVKL